MVCSPVFWPAKMLSICTAGISILIGVIAILGNGLIILAVILDPLKKLHSPFNYFLVNLAVSDLILGIVAMPLSAVNHFQESLGWVDDKFVVVLRISYAISTTSSLMSLMALSVDRYSAVSSAIKYRQRFSWNRCKRITALIWFVSISLPFLYFKLGWVRYLMFFACTSVLTGLILMVVVYRKIQGFLRTNTSIMRRYNKGHSTTSLQQFDILRMQKEKSVTRTFLVIIAAYVAVNIPAVIFIFTLIICPGCDCKVRHALRDTEFLLIAANSCVNPFICTIRLKPYFKSILALFKPCTRCWFPFTVKRPSSSSQQRCNVRSSRAPTEDPSTSTTNSKLTVRSHHNKAYDENEVSEVNKVESPESSSNQSAVKQNHDLDETI